MQHTPAPPQHPAETAFAAMQAALARLQHELTAYHVLKALENFGNACEKAGFDPNQPRVPAGSPDGGQWAGGGSGGGHDHGSHRRPDHAPTGGNAPKPLWVEHSNASMRAALANAEKPGVNKLKDYGYGTFNGVLDSVDDVALGGYQFRNLGLQDLGLKNKTGKWLKNTKFYEVYHITSDREFLNNPAAQEDVLTAYLARKEQATGESYRQYNGYAYIGIRGKSIKVTQAGLLAAAHRAGEGTIKKYLSYVHKHGGTREMTFAQLEKAVEHGALVETRLREFQDMPYASSGWPVIIPDPRAPRQRRQRKP